MDAIALSVKGRFSDSSDPGDYLRKMLKSPEEARFLSSAEFRNGNRPAPPAIWILGRNGEVDFDDCVFFFTDSFRRSQTSGGATAQQAPVAFALNFELNDSLNSEWKSGDDDVRDAVNRGFAAAVSGCMEAARQHFATEAGINDERIPLKVYGIDYFHTLKRLNPQPALHHHVFMCNVADMQDGRSLPLHVDSLIESQSHLTSIVNSHFGRAMSG